MTGIANIALLSEETGRIFGLDAQLLFDILIQGLAVFLLFIFLTYVLINPVRKVLEDRQNKIKDDHLSDARRIRLEQERAYLHFKWPRAFVEGDPFSSSLLAPGDGYYQLYR